MKSRIGDTVRLDYFYKTLSSENRDSGIWRFKRFKRFWRFWRFCRNPGIWPDSGIPGRGPSSGQIRDLAGIGQIWGPARGPRIGVSGVQNRPDPGSQIRGKSTLSATMVSVVSTSTDPDFGRFLEKIRKIGVPGQKNPGPGDPGNGRFRGSRGPGSGAQIRPDSGSGARFRDSGVRGQISRFWPDSDISGTLGPKTSILPDPSVLGTFPYVGQNVRCAPFPVWLTRINQPIVLLLLSPPYI